MKLERTIIIMQLLLPVIQKQQIEKNPDVSALVKTQTLAKKIEVVESKLSDVI